MPNGACGFHLEYILHKRFSLSLDERDDITNSCINAYNKSNLTEFSKHVAKIATDTNRQQRILESNQNTKIFIDG